VKLLDSVSDHDMCQIVSESTSLKEVLLRIGYSGTSQINPLKKRMETLGISINRGKFIKEHETPDDKVYIKNSSYSHIRERVLKDNYMEYQCSSCGIKATWNGNPLTLQLDHIDGDCHNNTKENLRWLCPNCHSQTSNYGNKDGHRSKRRQRTNEKGICPVCDKLFIKKNRNQICCSNACACKLRTKPVPVEREELMIALKNTKNFEAVGRMYGVTGQGVRKWCKRYNMPTHVDDYK